MTLIHVRLVLASWWSTFSVCFATSYHTNYQYGRDTRSGRMCIANVHYGRDFVSRFGLLYEYSIYVDSLISRFMNRHKDLVSLSIIV
jgi:hypothetical protein